MANLNHAPPTHRALHRTFTTPMSARHKAMHRAIQPDPNCAPFLCANVLSVLGSSIHVPDSSRLLSVMNNRRECFEGTLRKSRDGFEGLVERDKRTVKSC